jgi:hypothetical protein
LTTVSSKRTQGGFSLQVDRVEATNLSSTSEALTQLRWRLGQPATRTQELAPEGI